MANVYQKEIQDLRFGITFVASSRVKQISDTILLPRSPSFWSPWSWFLTKCQTFTPLSRSGVIMGALERRLSGLPVYRNVESGENEKKRLGRDKRKQAQIYFGVWCSSLTVNTTSVYKERNDYKIPMFPKANSIFRTFLVAIFFNVMYLIC